MRKLIAIIFSFLLFCTGTLAVSAAEAQYPTAGDLYEAWHNNLPDYICGVWSTDGGTTNLTFGIQNNPAGNAGKQEIFELIENDSSITFVYQTFSRNYLLEIQKEIDRYFEKNLGLISTGLDDLNNCIVIGISDERKADPDTQRMIEEITAQYADAVKVDYNGAIIALTTLENKHDYTQKIYYAQQSWFFPVAMILFLGGVVFIIAARNNALLLQTKKGNTLSKAPLPSVQAVEEMVKKSTCHIPTDLKQRVMNEVDKISSDK